MPVCSRTTAMFVLSLRFACDTCLLTVRRCILTQTHAFAVQKSDSCCNDCGSRARGTMSRCQGCSHAWYCSKQVRPGLRIRFAQCYMSLHLVCVWRVVRVELLAEPVQSWHGVQCQAADWKRGHKALCKSIRNMRSPEDSTPGGKVVISHKHFVREILQVLPLHLLFSRCSTPARRTTLQTSVSTSARSSVMTRAACCAALPTPSSAPLLAGSVHPRHALAGADGGCHVHFGDVLVPVALHRLQRARAVARIAARGRRRLPQLAGRLRTQRRPRWCVRPALMQGAALPGARAVHAVAPRLRLCDG